LAVSCVLAAVMTASIARAHDVGVSFGRYAWQGERVYAAVTFAQRELASSLPRVLGQGGPLAFEENRAALGDWMVQHLMVTAAGAACAGSFHGMRLEGDSVALALSYACPALTGDLRIDARFVGALGRGHRHLASLESASGQRDAVATAQDPAFSFEADATRGEAAPARGLWAFLRMGVEHILTGYDHLLFLVGLLLVGRPARALVAAITAFTLAHSITLALAALDVWAPAPTIVEPLIALSIAYVGIENWFVTDAKGRWRVTLVFGLVHGFGFAGALRAIAVPRSQVPLALFGFNLGVELGQLAVLAVLLPLVLWARESTVWQRAGMRACTAAVAGAGLVWFFVRLHGTT
jgi:hydrogenase/urease accessory protein HupE